MASRPATAPSNPHLVAPVRTLTWPCFPTIAFASSPLQLIMQPSLCAANRASCRFFLVRELPFGQPAASSLVQLHHLTEQGDRPLCVGPL
jgi:hypothetical protein